MVSNNGIKLLILIISLIVFQVDNVSLAACDEWHQITTDQTSDLSTTVNHKDTLCEDCPDHETELKNCCDQNENPTCHTTVFISDFAPELNTIPIPETHFDGSLQWVIAAGTSPPFEPPRP